MLAFSEAKLSGAGFTRPDHNMGYAFLIAALDCGYQENFLYQRVESFLNREPSNEYKKDLRPGVLKMAEGLKTFCD